MPDFKINNKGFWESTDSSGHLFDKSLSDTLIEFFKEENSGSIVDLGCGMAMYTKELINAGFKCDAYDGNPNTVMLTEGLGEVLDLSTNFNLKKYDWVLSLEVGEHIPHEYENIFLNNLVKHALYGIIISWAIPGQKGDGHVNCKNNKYIIKQMKRRGFKHDVKAERKLRDKSTFHWFKNTIMVFKKVENLNNRPPFLFRYLKFK